MAAFSPRDAAAGKYIGESREASDGKCGLSEELPKNSFTGRQIYVMRQVAQLPQAMNILCLSPLSRRIGMLLGHSNTDADWPGAGITENSAIITSNAAYR